MFSGPNILREMSGATSTNSKYPFACETWVRVDKILNNGFSRQLKADTDLNKLVLGKRSFPT